MRKFLKTLSAAAVLSLTAQTALAQEEVVVYHWFEYLPQSVIDKFTEETGIAVVMDTYDSNESMLANLKAGAMGTYDVAVPGDYMVEIMAGSGMVGSIAEGELANKGNIQDMWMDVPFDQGRTYSIPYQWGSTSFSVNKDVHPGNVHNTNLIFNPPASLSGKINMLDSQGEVMALAALHMDIPQCSTDRDQLKALNAMLLDAKQHWASFNSDTTKDLLVSGDAAVSMIWNGYSAKARSEGANIEYAYPDQGYLVWMDNVVLLKDAPNRANALKFMDFLLVPENIALVTNYAQYSAGVDGVTPLLDEALRTSPESNPRAGIKAEFVQVCDQATQSVYDQIWTNLRK
jgi:spermidine/putrescine transport system substrate-binding protein